MQSKRENVTQSETSQLFLGLGMRLGWSSACLECTKHYIELGVTAQTCDTSIRELEAGRIKGKELKELKRIDSGACLCYVRPFLKIKPRVSEAVCEHL